MLFIFLIHIGNNVNQTYFKNIISPLFSSQNQELRMDHDLLMNNNFKNNSNFIDDNDNRSPQNLNHEYIKSQILNRSLKNNPANYDNLIERIIDDLLIENVFELQEIEEKQEKIKQKENMKTFIKDYYKNFEEIKKLEDNVFEKLHSRDYGIRLNPQNPRIILDGKEDRRHIIYKNPFESAINKSIDEINQNSLIIVEKEALNNNKSNVNIDSYNKATLNSSSKNKNSNRSSNRTNDRKSRTRKKEKQHNKNSKENKDHENSRSKSRESIKNPKKLEEYNDSVNNQTLQSVPNEDNTMSLQEKIKQNFMSHLITNDYNLNYNNINDTNKKTYYVAKLHKNLPEICEKYKKEYDDYMKTTGVFFVPNVFLLYEDVVNKLTNEIFEECVSKSLKELDEMALNLVKSEVENKL